MKPKKRTVSRRRERRRRPPPRCGIIIEATPDELAALPFNPVYAEVRLVPANGAGENLYGKGVGR